MQIKSDFPKRNVPHDLKGQEQMANEMGSYAQIIIPEYDIDYDRDMNKSLIGDLYLPAWQKFGLFRLKQKNTQATVRAYSMANYPDEGDIITLTVRIATPPFKPKEQCPNGPEFLATRHDFFMDVPCGIASTYIFSLKPGDKVLMSGPYGEFRPIYDSQKEMIWVGGGAGMAPLRAQIMHMLKTRNCRDREMHYVLAARARLTSFFNAHALSTKSSSSTISSLWRRSSRTSISTWRWTVRTRRQTNWVSSTPRASSLL